MVAQYCQHNKDLDVYAYCIMTSHVHLIIGSRGNPMSNIMRDLKRHTSEKLRKQFNGIKRKQKGLDDTNDGEKQEDKTVIIEVFNCGSKTIIR
ncbi:MAG: transposase [Chitinophagales bacterium]